MTERTTTRREFIRAGGAGLSTGWLLLNLPLVTSLAACARDAAERGEPFSTLSPEEGRALDAFVARIIPSDDGTPGAREAGAAHFVDAAIAGPFADMAEPVRAGLADLDRRAAGLDGSTFAALPAERQDEVIRDFESSDLFAPLRILTVLGTVASPARGGNRDYVGWRMLGMEHAPVYRPPFGYYDAEVAPPASDTPTDAEATGGSR